MTEIIESYAGNTEETNRLRDLINYNLQKGKHVKVMLYEPAIRFQDKKNDWKTIIDFINEFEGKPVSFYGCIVALRETQCELNFTNDMFLCGHTLYETDERCKKLLKKLQPIESTRSYFWDLLLGHSKPWKDRIYKIFNAHPVSHKTLHNYFKDDPSKGIWSGGYRPRRTTAETLDGNMNPFKDPVRHSDLIDIDVYNQCYYNVAVETSHHQDFAVFNERVAKPIMAKRPFVLYGSRHHLRAFRGLGFQTFDDVIDESYDDIVDDELRFLKMCDSMLSLCEKDPVEVYNALQKTLDHNKKHFLENNWVRV